MAAPPPLCARTLGALESSRKAPLGQAPQIPRRVLAAVPRAHLRAYIPHKAPRRPPPGACWEMEFRPLGPHCLPGSGVRGGGALGACQVLKWWPDQLLRGGLWEW